MTNKNLEKLSSSYLFSQIGKIIEDRKNVIDLSVGDVKLPLPQEVTEAARRAADELCRAETFRGYPPESGYDFFKRAVATYYSRRNLEVDCDEIFVSDGIKSDMNLFLSVLERGKVLLPSPTYPAYAEANIIRGNEVIYYDVTPPDEAADIVVICSPDNPTGRVMTRSELSAWVEYADSAGAVILFDAAYEAFVKDKDALRSIFEIEGARKCAVEFCSFSKTAGFTGVRCGYTVVPKECGLNDKWRRVKSCCTNGVSYITQRMAECALTTAYDKVVENTAYYLQNASLLLDALEGGEVTGGKNSPYIWLRCGDSYKEFFKLLDMYGLGVTPGAGFGKGGEEFVRINSFALRDDIIAAADRLKRYMFCK